MKNPFKKSGVIDTVVNVGIGGAANVAMDYLFKSVPTLALDEQTKNLVKVAVSAFGGSMVSGSSAKYIRPALDGIGVVGASKLIESYLPTGEGGGDDGEGGGDDQKGTKGLPFIGKLRKFRPMRGTGSVAFMQ